MCGICGIVSPNNRIKSSELLKMTRVMRHRGPDDEGFILIDSQNSKFYPMHHDETIEEIKGKTERLNDTRDANIAFGFRRLSIIDLSSNGHQPMSFGEVGLWIVFNGEIYNYIELRDELKQYGYSFNSNTDTEVILKAYHKWGEKCVEKFNGMWAFAMWDSKRNKLFCSRDRFGIKPFYYHSSKEKFFFASELKSILQVIKAELNQNSLYDYFAFGYTDHNEHTFFQNIKQLRGGHNLTYFNGTLNINRYYDLPVNENNDSFEIAKNKFRELLFESVKIRLRSDVPLGYALSGGIDSSSIVGIATKLNKGSNNTFSMIYPGGKVDESFYVKKVIEQTGVNEHFTSPTVEDLLNDLQNFVYYQEEPFTGTSYYGEFKLRELIRKGGVTVSLEGQGADEIISGYTSLILPYLYDLIKYKKFYDLYYSQKKYSYLFNGKFSLFKNYLRRNNRKISLKNLSKKFSFLNLDNNMRVSGERFHSSYDSGSFLNNSLYEMLFYTSIPQQLIKADKNAMAFSVECRFPFLDHNVVEYAMSLPFYYKMIPDCTKYILRESMRDLLPTEVYGRKDKIGFEIPTEEFDTYDNRTKILEMISGVNTSILFFINKDSFIKHYLKNPFDWKFWKTASVLLWYERFFNN